VVRFAALGVFDTDPHLGDQGGILEGEGDVPVIAADGEVLAEVNCFTAVSGDELHFQQGGAATDAQGERRVSARSGQQEIDGHRVGFLAAQNAGRVAVEGIGQHAHVELVVRDDDLGAVAHVAGLGDELMAVYHLFGEDCGDVTL